MSFADLLVADESELVEHYPNRAEHAADGIVHAVVGKLSFDNAALRANFDAFVDAIVKAKPAGAKGKYLKKIGLSSSMGPGLKIDVAEVHGG